MSAGTNANIIDTHIHPLNPVRLHEDARGCESTSTVKDDDAFVGMDTIIFNVSRIEKTNFIGAIRVVYDGILSG